MSIPGNSRSPDTNLSPRTISFMRPSAVETLIGRCLANVTSHCGSSGSLPSDSGMLPFISFAIAATSPWRRIRPLNFCSSMLFTADSCTRAASRLFGPVAGGRLTAASWLASDLRAVTTSSEPVVLRCSISG